LIGEEDPGPGNHLEIETNIDDMNPQILGHVMAKLFQAGALDVYFTPIFMKKNRPATKLSVIVRREDELTICDLILRDTSTLGLRVTPVWRHEAEREMRNVTTVTEMSVKLKMMDGNVIQATPEFDACCTWQKNWVCQLLEYYRKLQQQAEDCSLFNNKPIKANAGLHQDHDNPAGGRLINTRTYVN
jgi:uncharacterized protein (DUF111 family)